MNPPKLSGAKPRLKPRPYDRFIAVIQAVPRGKVVSYGQVAALAGHPGQARQVVWALSSSSKKFNLPWHRVINSQGKIAIKDERYFARQKILLEREGVTFDERGVVDLKAHQWVPSAKAVARLRI